MAIRYQYWLAEGLYFFSFFSTDGWVKIRTKVGKARVTLHYWRKLF